MKRSGRHQRFPGQSLVEFALVAPIFFLMLFGVIEMGRLIWINHELANGTREAARFAMVRGSEASACATVTDLENVILDRTSAIQSGQLDLTGNTGPLCGEPGTKVVIEAEYDFDPMLGIIPGLNSLTLNARSEVIVQH